MIVTRKGQKIDFAQVMFEFFQTLGARRLEEFQEFGLDKTFEFIKFARRHPMAIDTMMGFIRRYKVAVEKMEKSDLQEVFDHAAVNRVMNS